jgi:hypothetical protein
VKKSPLRLGFPLVLLALTACGDDGTGPTVDSLALEAGTAAITISDTTRIRAAVNGANGQGSTIGVSWASLDPKVASIDGTGLVTGLARGTVRIVGKAGGASDTARIHVVPRQYNVQSNSPCDSPDYRGGRVVAVSDYAIVVADTANPSGGFTAADYASLAGSFDKLVYPIVTENFGKPTDIDGNERVIIFYTRAVNELTPAGSKGYVGGFFFARDLFPRAGTAQAQGCAHSNEAELFYMMVPDPSGLVNGNKREKSVVQRITLGTIAHEFQHLINGSRRLYVNPAEDWETTWLNEGLSHVAEELMFYHASGLAPKQNIDTNRLRSVPASQAVDAFNAFQISNLARLAAYYEAPESHSGYSDEAELGDRGAVWHYLRYLADRSTIADRDIWFRLANSTTSGFANLTQVLGQDTRTLYRDWAIATYTDDLVATKDSRFQQPSWNNRAIIAELDMTPPSARALVPGVTAQATLHGGGSSYLQFSIPSAQRAEIQVRTGTGLTTPGACVEETPPLALEVGEVYTPAAGSGSPLCLDGGAGGGSYAVVVTSMGSDSSRTTVAVTGFGIAPPATASTTLLAADRVPQPRRRFRTAEELEPLLARVGETAPARDFSVHAHIRRQEALFLESIGRRTGGRRAAGPLLQQSPGGSGDLFVSLVRVK